MGRLRKRLGRYRRQILRQPMPSRAPGPASSDKAAPAPKAPVQQTPELSPLEVRRAELAKKRVMGPHAFTWLTALLESADEVLTLREAAARGADLPPRAVALRHDIDHDIDNAVRLATLESALGLKSTYFVLHNAWYYRWQSEGISPLTLDALERIASMGHEIAFHNDVLGESLETGMDPVELLRKELAELRSHGFDVVGTSGHGGLAVRKARLRNFDVFAEQAGTAPRTLEREDGGAVTYTPIPQSELGLEYEAYSVAQALYLSDAGARWNQPPELVRAEFERGLGPLQVLTHPEHWALAGESVTLRKAPARRPAHQRRTVAPLPVRSVEQDRPMRIISRGDCCSRRAVSMNKDLFGNQFQYIKDEKSRSDFFVDHPLVGSPTRADILRYVDVERVKSASQRHYLFCQTDRSTLAVRDADLLVLDSYGDMNFQAWQHKTDGWRLWAPLALLRDREAFTQEFESVGYLSLDESVSYHVALIEYYRRMNGDIPVLFLDQPIAYFDKLRPREQFRELGARLEQEVPHLYYGVIDDDDLEPDDMNSSGPGQTLHFTAATYRAMIEVALEKGLAQWMPRTSVAFPS